MHKTAVEDLSKAVWADQKEIAGGFLALGFSLGPYFFSTVPVPFLQLCLHRKFHTFISRVSWLYIRFKQFIGRAVVAEHS